MHGFFNVGNTCYLNVILQLLLNMDGFKRNIKKLCDNLPGNTRGGILLNEFMNLYNTQNTLKFKETLGLFNNFFKSYNQEDAHECLIILLDIIHEETKNILTKNTINKALNLIYLRTNEKIDKLRDESWKTYIDKFGYSVINLLFSGQIMNYMSCVECGLEKFNFEIFNTIQLDLRNNIYDSFNDLYKIEEIVVKCDKCNVNTKHNKRMLLWEFPRYLIITLKRFDVYGNKINDVFNIDTQLQFETRGMIFKYDLISSVQHMGNTNTRGHYTNIIKKDDRYYFINDEKIHEINEEKYNFFINSKMSYIYIFERNKVS